MINQSDNFTASITPDVMRVLESCRFFGRLDDLLSPMDGSRQPEKCDGSFRLSERLLKESGFGDARLRIAPFIHSGDDRIDCRVCIWRLDEYIHS